jgi:hypothetical protein
MIDAVELVARRGWSLLPMGGRKMTNPGMRTRRSSGGEQLGTGWQPHPAGADQLVEVCVDRGLLGWSMLMGIADLDPTARVSSRPPTDTTGEPSF